MALHPQDATESAGARHAALFLHGIAPADRAWVLDAMSADERASLQALLAELEAVGIASDPTSIREALPLSEEDMLLALRGEGLATVIDALRREPAGLLANWLRVADWPWHEDLLRALEPNHRTRVESALAATGPVPPALRAELIAAVAVCLRQPAPRVPSPGRWHALAQALRRMWPTERIRRRASR